MDSRELRIGNYIRSYIFHKRVYEVTADILSTLEKDENSLYEYIPIDRDWVDDMGFWDPRGIEAKDIFGKIYITANFEGHVSIYKDIYSNSRPVLTFKVDYVHELQNLFFDLTKVHLTHRHLNT